MITISKPFKRIDENNIAYLCCNISSNTNNLYPEGIGRELFYSVPSEYSDYLVDEVSDSFVIIALLPALINSEDITVEAPVSSALFYNLNKIVYLLAKAFKVNTINVHSSYVETDFHPTVNATGFSGGVDSICTFLKHTSESCPVDYRIGLLTLFNVGAYGNEYEQTKIEFEKDILRAEEFAKEVNMPLLCVDSNIGAIFSHPRIFHYSLRLTLCLSSAVLAVGKLIQNYFQSSGGTIDLMKLSEYDQAYYDDALAHLISTKTTTFHIAENDMNRVEKTKFICNSPLSQRYLYVCAASVCNANQGTSFKQDTAPNCGECMKCKRTILALDMLGVLPHFSNRFDLKKYKKQRGDMLIEVVKEKENNHFYMEIYELMLKNGIEIKLPHSFKKKLKSLIRKIGNNIVKLIG